MLTCYIYLDESGDLGFKSKSSTYFLLCGVRVEDEETNNKLKRIVKKIRQKKLKKSYKCKPELKFSNSNRWIREKILKEINKLNIKIYSVIIDKRKVVQRLKDEKPTLIYKYLIRILFEHTFKELDCNNLDICMDRVLSKQDMENLREYILTSHSKLLINTPNIKFLPEDSKGNTALQAIDFIAGALWHKYERIDQGYYKIIQEKLRLEKKLF